MPKEKEPKEPAGEQTPPEAPKTIEVPLEKLNALFDRVETLEKAREKDAETITALERTVSETRLAEARAEMGADKRKRYHFKKIAGKVVIGWPETVGEDKKNEWIFSPNNPTSPVGEILKCRYYFLDGTKSELLDQIVLARSTEQAYVREIEDLGDYVIVKFEDESVFKDPLKVHRKFLNA